MLLVIECVASRQTVFCQLPSVSQEEVEPSRFKHPTNTGASESNQIKLFVFTKALPVPVRVVQQWNPVKIRLLMTSPQLYRYATIPYLCRDVHFECKSQTVAD